MKVTPSNQTLILASERRGPGSSEDPLGKLAALSGSVLQRVTIVASQPDTTLVYVRADYSTVSDDHSGGTIIYGNRARSDAKQSGDPLVDPQSSQSSSLRLASPNASQSTALIAQQSSSTIRRDDYGNALADSRDAGISSYLKPVEQYAQTQRLLTETPRVQRLDLHA